MPPPHHPHHHRTSPHGTGHQQRHRTTVLAPTDDPPEPAGLKALKKKGLRNDPRYGSEFHYEKEIYGCFNETCTQRNIKIIKPSNWEDIYIKQISIPEIPKLHSVRLHRRIAPQFKAFFKAVAQRGHAGLVLSYSGSFVARTQGNQHSLSNHALGTAIDINSAQNKQGTPGAARGTRGSVHELADICSDFGIYWGGWFHQIAKKDLMHFEAVTVIDGDALRAVCDRYGLYPEDLNIGDWPLPPENGRTG